MTGQLDIDGFDTEPTMLKRERKTAGICGGGSGRGTKAPSPTASVGFVKIRRVLFYRGMRA